MSDVAAGGESQALSGDRNPQDRGMPFRPENRPALSPGVVLTTHIGVIQGVRSSEAGRLSPMEAQP